MKSAQESGVLNFIAGFQQVVTSVADLGSTYNPKPERLKTVNLQASLAQTNLLQAEVVTNEGIYRNAISARQAIYEPIRKFATRINNAFAITDADPNLKATVKGITAKFRSSSNKSRATASAASEGSNTSEMPRTHSTAQTGYDNLPGHLRRIIAIIETVPSYDPAESDLSLNSIKNMASTCDQANSRAMEAENRFNMARDRRDDFLYNKNTGLIAVTHEVKQYVKSAFGANSDVAKRIIAIRLA